MATVGIGAHIPTLPASGRPGVADPQKSANPPPKVSPPPPPDGTDSSALALITANLADWGLDGSAPISKGGTQTLAQWAWNEHLNGVSDTQIMLDLKQTDPYKYAYSGMAKLQAQGININEQQYQSQESTYLGIMHAAGIPDAMAQDKTFLGNLIGNLVSPAELQSRTQDLQNAVQSIPAEYRDQMRSQYGLDTSDLMGFWLNPDVAEPLIHQKVAAAQVGAAAAGSGFGMLDPQIALHLAGLGVSASQAATGFGRIAGEQQLTQDLGDGTGSISNNGLINATFDQNGVDANKAATVAAQRVAKFQGGGSFAASQTGVSGLGVGPQGF